MSFQQRLLDDVRGLEFGPGLTADLEPSQRPQVRPVSFKGLSR